MQIFRVGGYVRDKLLGLTASDCDYVVVGSSPAEMLKLGYQQVGKHFPVFLHPTTKEEYALARTEQKEGSGHTGFKVQASNKVTLEEDLARRDLTINAIAEDMSGKLIDPFNGQQDLKAGVLRHISQAFQEDPLRILRVARFSARFNFKVAPETLELLKRMALQEEIKNLSQERIFGELEKALDASYTSNFFQILIISNNLNLAFPLLAHNINNRLDQFLNELQQGTSKWEKYTILANYLSKDQQSKSELSNQREIQKYLSYSQQLQQQLTYELTEQQVLDLIKKTNALRNTAFFYKITQNYSWWLKLISKTNTKLAQKNLNIILLSLKILQNTPPELLLPNKTGIDIANAILTWQLNAIQQVQRQQNEKDKLVPIKLH